MKAVLFRFPTMYGYDSGRQINDDASGDTCNSIISQEPAFTKAQYGALWL
jgi:hypothetical protein